MPNDSASDTRITVVRNLLEKYGRQRVLRLLSLFGKNKSGQVIADEFGVSRERVRQWRNLLGRTVMTYETHADVSAALSSGFQAPGGEDVAG